MNSHEVFIHIHQGCFAGTGAIVRLPQCQWSKPDGYGQISQCITTTKHGTAKTVCIFLGIYCTCQCMVRITYLTVCEHPFPFQPLHCNQIYPWQKPRHRPSFLCKYCFMVIILITSAGINIVLDNRSSVDLQGATQADCNLSNAHHFRLPFVFRLPVSGNFHKLVKEYDALRLSLTVGLSVRFKTLCIVNIDIGD